MEDPEIYLRKYHVLTYIEDAVSFILERKDEDAKTKPFELLAEYFKSIKAGTHILFREYTFVCATPHNRVSFVKLFSQSYTEIAARNELMRVADYLSLLRLLCHDFPVSTVEKVGQVLFTQNTMDNLVSFPDFLYTFQTLFYYEHFLSLCELIFMNGDTPHTPYGSGTVVVSMPSATEQDSISRPTTSEGESTSQIMSDTFQTELSGKKLDSVTFVTAVVCLVQRLQDKEPWECCPTIEILYEVMQGMDSVSFFDFVLSLAKSEKVNSEIGVLPLKIKLKSSPDKT